MGLWESRIYKNIPFHSKYTHLNDFQVTSALEESDIGLDPQRIVSLAPWFDVSRVDSTIGDGESVKTQ